MKAIDIHRHFISVADWVDPDRTVDKIILGDPDEEIHRVLVTWISSFRAVREAVERGSDMLITHEPTFWVHENEIEEMEGWDVRSLRRRIGSAKREFVEQNGLVILRVHDAWDGMPEIGIPWAWAQFLNLGTRPVKATRYQHRYDIEPLNLDELATRIAERTATIGEPYVQVVGDGSSIVSKVGVGTGCYCDNYIYQEMGCDVSIVCDDGSCYWSDIQCGADNDHPVIRVNHGTSEEPGMITMTKYLNDHLPVEAEHLPHGSCFRLVGEAR